MSRPFFVMRNGCSVCALWVAGASVTLQVTSVLEAKERAIHLGSPTSSDPPAQEDVQTNPSESAYANDASLELLPPIENLESDSAPDTYLRSVLSEATIDEHELESFAGVRYLDDGVFKAQALSLTVPTSVSTNLKCGTAQGVATWNAPIASSSCGGVSLTCNGTHLPTGTPWSQAQVAAGGAFPVGVSEFCCQATDACSNQLDKCWSVTVQNQTAMQVLLELSPTIHTPPSVGVNRCIEFEVFQNCFEPPIEFQSTVTFGGPFNMIGRFTGVVMIPGPVAAQCVTARDPQHSLRSCYPVQLGDCQSNGILDATFAGDPALNGNWLVGGNFDAWRSRDRQCRGGSSDGHVCYTDFQCPGGSCEPDSSTSGDAVDILDFGVLASKWLAHYDSDENGVADGHSGCSASMSNHADVNGDGFVDLLDFSFLTAAFLRGGGDCCCPGAMMAERAPVDHPHPPEKVHSKRMRELLELDTNRDGVIDVTDLPALFSGIQPTRPMVSRP